MRRKVLKQGGPRGTKDELSSSSPGNDLQSPSGAGSSLGIGSPAKLKPGALPIATRIANDNATYQLGAELGRGGFGAVFQALNVDTGDFAAVKRIELTDVDADNLSSIQMEIDLLKKLNHPNIVKYIDSIRTEHHLHIVLEFMENGSLAGVCKKFGNFSESLAAIYMTQVVIGLQYLHEQGVLHRDIKGANILTTKDGQVKLADFGVALKLSDSKQSDLDVVGSPYWMAPEIIEMNAPTSACDIWSLGCTIVELLTGKPPYFDLAAMAALFRIVQDDYPPLPDGISEALRDFLLQCFKKEPLLRKSAQELLKHPWLKNPRNHLERVKQQATSIAPSSSSSSSGFGGVGGGSAAAGGGGGMGGGGISIGREITSSSGSSHNVISRSGSSASGSGGGQEPEEESVVNTIRLYARGAGTVIASPSHSSSSSSRIAKLPSRSASAEEPVAEKEATRKKGAWRSLLKDFQDGITGGSFSSKDTTASSAVTVVAEGGGGGGNSAKGAAGGGGLVASGSANLDEEDPFFDFDDDSASSTTNNRKKPQQQHKASEPIPIKISQPGSSSRSPPPFVGSPSLATSARNLIADGGFDDLVIGDDDDDHHQQPQPPLPPQASSSTRPARKSTERPPAVNRLSIHQAPAGYSKDTLGRSHETASMLDRYREDDDFNDDHDMDLEWSEEATDGTTGDGGGGGGGGGGQHHHGHTGSAVLRQKVAVAVAEKDVHDDAIFLEDIDFENQPDKGAHLRRAAEVGKIVDQIKADSKDKFVRESCARILEMFDEHPEQPAMFVTQHGVIPIMQMLEVRSLAAMPSVLSVINRIIQNDAKVQEHLSFLGFIPTIIKFAGSTPPASLETPTPSSHGSSFLSGAFFSSSHRRESSQQLEVSTRAISPLRFEAAKCIHQICTTSKLCLQMFIGCGGLPVLVELVATAEDTNRSPEAKKLSLIGIECIVQIFTHLDNRRNDFCRLFAKLGLLPFLSVAFLHMLNSTAWNNRVVVGEGGNHSSSSSKPAGEELTHLIFTAETWGHTEKVATILSHFSRADPFVKGAMAHEGVLTAMMKVFSPPSAALLDLPPYADLVLTLLKCVKNISFQENTLEKLDGVGAIRCLVPLMDRRGHAKDKEMENQALHCMYNLCRVNKKRQEKAAVAGITPLLMRCYRERSHMKEVALSIMCDLAHTSDVTREELWKNAGVDFYLLLLLENYWQVPALNSLSVWLSNDVKRVESVLVRPSSIESLVGMIHSSQGKTFEQISGPLLDMMSKSVPLRKALGNSASFVTALLSKLQNPKAIVRKPVLTLLKMVYQHHDKKASFIQEYHEDLYPAIKQLAQDNSQVLVKDLALQLLHDFDRHTPTRR